MSKTTYVAFLRGINVGGNATVPMADLKACFEQMGFEAVRTYINSGNVIFRDGNEDPRRLETSIENTLQTTFKLPITVVVRNEAQIQDLLEHLPDSWSSATPQKCNVIFLRHTIDSADLTEEFKPKPGVEELHYYPGALLWSAATSNLTKSNMIKLSLSPKYKEMTVRIVNTVHKVYALMQEASKTA